VIFSPGRPVDQTSRRTMRVRMSVRRVSGHRHGDEEQGQHAPQGLPGKGARLATRSTVETSVSYCFLLTVNEQIFLV